LAPDWILCILIDDYGYPVTSATDFQVGEEEPGRPEKLPLNLPPEIRVQSILPGKTLAQMIGSGEIDALYATRAPSSFKSRAGKVRRLFENYHAAEREYFEKTKIFPIMHVVVIRRDIYEKNPWVAQSLCKAFALAQHEAYEELRETAALTVMLPWLVWYAAETEQLLGRDFLLYGL